MRELNHGHKGNQFVQDENVNDSNFKENWKTRISYFDNMFLNEDLLHGIYSYGFKTPSNIQQ